MKDMANRLLRKKFFHTSFLLLLGILFASSAQAQNDTLRIMAWNLLNYTKGGSATNYEAQREPYYRTVIEDADPDIISAEEVWSDLGATRFKNNVLEVIAPGKWAMSPLTGKQSDDVQLYYRTDRGLSLGSTYLISAPTRAITQCEVRYDAYGVQDTIFICMAHLKASDSSTDAATRTQEINAVIDWLGSKGRIGRNILFCGDFNLYRSSGPEWPALIANDVFRDPVNRVGSWHDNSSFKDVHTQCPQLGSLDGFGSGGGMDDRFDFIMASPQLFDSSKFDYVPGSYHAFGNDGNHFNQDINYGTNTAVSTTVANALHSASDHLPVVMDVAIEGVNSVSEERGAFPESFRIVSVYPNPFNGTASVSLSLMRAGQVRMEMFDVLGRRVWSEQEGRLDAGLHRLALPAGDLSSGVYLVRATSNGASQVRRVTLVR